MQPRQVLNLNFSAPDTVAEILVQPGQRVEQGAPLARLDTADLKLRLDQAKATLAQAEASKSKLTSGATPAEVAAAEAASSNRRRAALRRATSPPPAPSSLGPRPPSPSS